jgi:hypothetical protein
MANAIGLLPYACINGIPVSRRASAHSAQLEMIEGQEVRAGHIEHRREKAKAVAGGDAGCWR